MAAKSTAAKKSRSNKSAAAAAQNPEIQVGMSDTVTLEAAGGDAGEVVVDPAGEGLDALLAGLETPVAADAPISRDVVVEETHTDAVLEAAVASAEATDAALAMATPEGVVEAGAAPTGDASDVPAADASAATPKKTPTPRKHYTNKVERLKDRMGASLAEYTVLTMEDAGVTEEELKAKMDETLGIIGKMNKKKQARASSFIEFLAGKKPKANEILERTLKVLARDGKITTGNDGNVFQDLIAKPYTPAAARAMGGNTISMLEDLKVIVPGGEKQTYIANENSVLLAKANSLVFAAPAAAAEPAAA